MSVHDRKEPETCRKCGSLVTPRNVQCRRCGRYRHAGPVENAILHGLIPQSVSPYAATVIIGAVIVLWEVIIAIATRGDALPSASSFTLIQFGAMNGPHVLFGEWWRASTSIFLHHGVIHLLMNLYALFIVGRVLESFTDRYRVASVFLFGGILSMVISHGWYALAPFSGTPYAYVSAGASGGISALIGAAYMAARKQLQTQHIEKTMLRWSIFMLIFGLFVGGINNAAHIGGWVVGALFTELILIRKDYVIPITKVVSGVCIAVVLGSFAMAGLQMKGLPSYTPNSAHDRQSILLPGKKGVSWGRSAESQAWNTCREHVEARDYNDASKAEEMLHDCKLNAALNPYQPGAWRMMELAYMGVQQPKRAQAARRVARKIAH